MYTLRARIGANLWSYTTGDFVGSSPAVANGLVCIGSSDSNVYAFGLKYGSQQPVAALKTS